MTQQDPQAALRAALSTTFESVAFAVPDEELTEAQLAAAPVAAVRVGFHGPTHGAVVLLFYGADLIDELTAAMCGYEEPVTSELRRDAIGELGNVVTGNTLPLLAGVDAEYLLDPPAPRPTHAPADSVAQVILGLSTGRIEAHLVIL